MIQAQGNVQNEGKMIVAKQKEQDQIAKERENFNKFRYDFILEYGQSPEEYMSNKQKF